MTQTRNIVLKSSQHLQHATCVCKRITNALCLFTAGTLSITPRLKYFCSLKTTEPRLTLAVVQSCRLGDKISPEAETEAGDSRVYVVKVDAADGSPFTVIEHF